MGDALFSCIYFSRYGWKAGVILRRTGPVSYDVLIRSGSDHPHSSKLGKRLANIDHTSEEKEIDPDVESAFDAADGNVKEQADQKKPHIPFPLLPKQQIPPVYTAVQTASQTVPPTVNI